MTHVDERGRASMVDVSRKSPTERTASAEAVIVLSEQAYKLATSGSSPKGDVFAAARLAGIAAAKKTADLIPLCHAIMLSHVTLDVDPVPDRHALRLVAIAKTIARTGVEMEALTAASIAALTVYDMIKAVDRSATIESVRLLAKTGGKSGSYQAPAEPRAKGRKR
ncbi:MAG: cyclic pyranopterin monophosphate synthase MoaC [Alphaproteobacteria bacterium]